MEHTFTTKVEVDINYGSIKPQGFSYESHRAYAVIKYIVRIDMRDWGIKDLCVYVPEQEIELDLELIEDHEEDSESFACKVSLKDCSIESNGFKFNHQICPETLTLELKNFRMKSAASGIEFEADGIGELVFASHED